MELEQKSQPSQWILQGSLWHRIGIFLKNTLLTTLFNIILPTADTFTDLRLIHYLYYYVENEGNTIFSMALLLPFLLNYFLSWRAWFRFEKDKKNSWRFPMYNLYPQYHAAGVVKLFWTDPTKAEEKMTQFQREISLTENFAESIPTVLILTSIGEKVANEQIQTSFTISLISASFGLAKCLKIGVCRTMGEGGLLGGILSGRFLLAMLASGAVLWNKTALIFISVIVSVLSFNPILIFCALQTGGFQAFVTQKYAFQDLLVTGAFVFLPQFLLAVFSVVDFRSGNSLRILYRQPSLLLLPTFTCFTFSGQQGHLQQEDDDSEYGGNCSGDSSFVIVLLRIFGYQWE